MMMAVNRRAFVKQLAGLGGLLVTPNTQRAAARRLGLQVYTVRDRLAKDFEGTLAAVAAAGYAEVELFGTLGDRSPADVRAILDRVGLAAVSTHIAVTPGPGLEKQLEKQLEGYRVMGHRYTAVRADPAQPADADAWKRTADTLNAVGRAGQPFGIRALFHNHVVEFVPLRGGGTGYDLLLRHTDPDLVVMELDIGWASIAGQDPIALFTRHPGRFALWHVKDTAGLAAITARPIGERLRAAQFVPVGAGDVDYRAVFAAADTAGLRHFFIEQDNAVNGDSLSAIATSAAHVRRILH